MIAYVLVVNAALCSYRRAKLWGSEFISEQTGTLVSRIAASLYTQ